jgi:hypothetical protein
MWWKIVLIAIGSIIVLAVSSITIGNIIFKRKANSEAARLLAKATSPSPDDVITEEDIKVLPEPVQKYLRFTGTIGKERVQNVRLKQKGSFRQGDNPWMSFTAEQYYTINPPAFIWIADMKAFPLVSVKGRDMNFESRGNMVIKIPPFVTIADARGQEIDQGTLVRYLNEIMWFPSAYLSDYISWEDIDSTRAKATITFGDNTASAILYFDEGGRMVNFEAQRYYIDGTKTSLETWTTPIKEYKEINDMRLPVKGEGVWKLDSGDFPYIKVEITDIDYNNQSLF